MYYERIAQFENFEENFRAYEYFKNYSQNLMN